MAKAVASNSNLESSKSTVPSPPADVRWWNSMERQLRDSLDILKNLRVEAAPGATSRRVRNRLRTLQSYSALYRFRGNESPEEIAWWRQAALLIAEELSPLFAARDLTPTFMHRWGSFQFAAGVVRASGLLWAEDPAIKKRSKAAGESTNVDLKRRWVSRELLPLIAVHRSRKAAEDIFVDAIEKLFSAGAFPIGFPKSWFNVLSATGGLKSTYRDTKLTRPKMQRYAAMGEDGLPPRDLLIYPNLKVRGRIDRK